MVKVGQEITFCDVRPFHWNKKGKMDHYLGRTHKVQYASSPNSDGLQLIKISGSPYTFLNTDLKEMTAQENTLVIQPKVKSIVKVNDQVTLMLPVRVFRTYSDGSVDVCTDNGDCIRVNSKLLNFKQTDMKAMKDAVLAVAKKLAKANNTVTTLEIKNELRRDYPYYYWTQQVVSDFTAQFAGDGVFSFTDNGTFRTYSLSTPKVIATTAGPVSKSLSKKSAKKTVKKTKAITQVNALSMANDVNFASVVVLRKAGPAKYTRSDIRNQKKSVHSFVSREVGRIQSITIGTKTYTVK